MTTNIARRHFVLTTAAMAGLPIFGRGVAAETPNVVWPAIIVGSGYGGAVSAYHLAHHGIPTLIIEMGKRWPQTEHPFHPMLTPGKSSVWLKNWNILPFGVNLPVPYYTGVLDRVDLPGKQVYVGRGYGGGSLVNGGMAVVPKRDYFREVFPYISDAKMDTTTLWRKDA
jgi:cholesterol oxidase